MGIFDRNSQKRKPRLGERYKELEDLVSLISLLSPEANILTRINDQYDVDGHTILQLAIIHHNLPLMQQYNLEYSGALSEFCQDQRKGRFNGKTPLMTAMAVSNGEAIEILSNSLENNIAKFKARNSERYPDKDAELPEDIIEIIKKSSRRFVIEECAVVSVWPHEALYYDKQLSEAVKFTFLVNCFKLNRMMHVMCFDENRNIKKRIVPMVCVSPDEQAIMDIFSSMSTSSRAKFKYLYQSVENNKRYLQGDMQKLAHDISNELEGYAYRDEIQAEERAGYSDSQIQLLSDSLYARLEQRLGESDSKSVVMRAYMGGGVQSHLLDGPGA